MDQYLPQWKQIKDELNEDRYEKWKKRIDYEYILVNEDIKDNNFWNSKKGKYIRYLNSDEWKKIRELVLKLAALKCQKCKVKSADEVHHLTYQNLFNENL